MRKVLAIVALVGLLAGPASVWSAAGCCGEADCCKSGICPMHAKPATAEKADEPMHCHHAEAAPERTSNCKVDGQCSGKKQQAQQVPAQRAVLTMGATIPAPEKVRAARAPLPIEAALGFIPLPFEPPRTLA